MKCPYHDCQKDYNEKEWSSYHDGFLQDTDRMSPHGKELQNGKLHIKARECGFCHRFFYDISIGHIISRGTNIYGGSDKVIIDEFLLSYPSSKRTFESQEVPKKIISHYNEAERCRSVGSLTGTGACLRKTIYAVCDDKKIEGGDYREKINNLPVKKDYQELLKQIKWLGDNTTKPGEEKYTMEMADKALEILPLIIDELYYKDERAEKVSKLLANAKSKKLSEKVKKGEDGNL